MNDVDAAIDPYPCEGICRVDPDSGACLGCGRPLLTPSAPLPQAMAEETQQTSTPPTRA